MQIGLACDHAGFELKEELKVFLEALGVKAVDMGTFNEDSVDYPDFGILVTEQVSRGELEKGILVCGTGIGMSMGANKFPRIRAAVANDLYSSRCSREHNDANILIFGGRIVGKDLAKEIVKVWLETPFAGGRQKRRLEKIEALEKEKFKRSRMTD